ncbi:unnamed protein product [Strongylus vulgaris]|uniref:DNA repair and recombination protein RAD54-like n=1 Tax=Strongylus vulgaris TaxID=40348 RepID=A0A3P7LD38_STRVU|nr:unnamed protein product [Strongylus vulgaris]
MMKRRSLGMKHMNSSPPTVIHEKFQSPLVRCLSPEDGSKRRRKKPLRLQNPFNTAREDVIDPLRLKLIDKNAVMARDSAEHEAMIARLLSRPFTIPIAGYSLSGRILGMARSRMRVAMFDPYAENAVVLYAPPPLSAHEQLNMKEEDKLVASAAVSLSPSRRFLWKRLLDINILHSIIVPLSSHFGCIMADEMGLGKTLQCITLLYTLLRQSPVGKPTFTKVIIVCPSSLVKNWDKEIKKWLGQRICALPMDSGSKQEITNKLKAYMADGRVRAASPVLIISYETFRLYAKILHSSAIGMVICDEGHRLKNSDNLTYQALNGLQCDRRVLISGTPIQNDLLEYFSLVNFVNPGLLGTASEFKKRFENPILRGRDGNATDEEQKKGEEATKEMVTLVEKCIIRRTSALLTKYLPVKYEHVICCRNTELQNSIYNKLIETEKRNRAIERDKENGATASALSFITHLKKLCNHPYLVYEELQKSDNRFHSCLDLFPDSFNAKKFDPSTSGKMKLCKLRGYGYVRLDGSMSIKQRAKTVEKFNDPESSEFCFLLSSKAGGCGLNLIGANRLVMFDPDWNPANDDQAMARVWRDGQKKNCFIYRLLATGSIEEKMFQRQTHKKALSSCVVDAGQDVARHFSADQLRELFKLEADTPSDTHERLKCKRCISGIESVDPPETADCTSDLALWHHSQRDARKVADSILRSVFSCGAISFVFHQKSHNVEVPKKKKEQEDEEYKPCEEEETDD